jgi:acyl-CoA synthetase (AMP-forming)/AMP-acid ligase II
MGRSLAGMGLTTGDRMALLLCTVPEFVEVLHGVWRIGAVAAPANGMLLGEPS